MKILLIGLLLSFSTLSFGNEKKCIMYYDKPTDAHVAAFTGCEWRPLFEFYYFEKSFIGPLEEGTHCSIEHEKRVARPNLFYCSTNSAGLSNQAFFNKMFLRCEEIGPGPNYQVYRTWFEEKEIFEECVVI
jgi:hypothetical protein